MSLGKENDEAVEDNDDYSDWEDLEENRSVIKKMLLTISPWCVTRDRYLVSDQGPYQWLTQGSWYCEEELYSQVDMSIQTEKTEKKVGGRVELS